MLRGVKPLVWLRSLAIAAVLAPLLFFLVAAGMAYREAQRTAALRVDQSVRTAGEHAAKLFDTNRLLLANVRTLLGAGTAGDWRGREAELHATLKQLAEGLPQIRGIWYWDEHGRPVASSRMYPAPGELSVADRDYFSELRNAPPGSLRVSRPLVTRETAADVFVYAQRRELPDGRFGGVVMVSLHPTYFTDFYAELASTVPGLTLGLARADGYFLARLPAAEPNARLAPDGPMMRRITAGQTHARFLNKSAVDGVTRLVSYRQVGNYPLYVLSGLSRSAVLGEWGRDLILLAAFTFPLAAGLALVARLAMKKVLLEQAASQAREEESERRRRAEQALQDTRRLEALGRLTGGVAHDFNNLLAVVSNNVYLLRRVQPELQQSRQLQAIERSVQTGSQLTRQLLAFSKRQAVHPETVDLQAELPEFLNVVGATVGRATDLSVHVDPATPPIFVDRSELELALLNLVLNAKDALADAGRSRGQITVGARPATQQEVDACGFGGAVVQVRDNGTGIPAAVLDKVVEPFFTTKAQGKGSGLGLSQVKGFAEQAGGAFRIASEHGAFTEVTLTLPASTAPAAARAAPAAERPSLAGVRLLLVEDNQELATSTLDLLSRLGCSVTHVPDGDAAKALLADASAVDVVLSDIVMPGETSGWDLLEWVRARRLPLPVLLMTGYDREAKQAIHQGVHVLQKPVDPVLLVAAISELFPAARQDDSA